MDAIRETRSSINKDDIQGLLNALTHAHSVSVGTPGLGNLLKIETDFGKGSALIHKANVVHMDFFPDDTFADPQWRLDLRRDQRLND